MESNILANLKRVFVISSKKIIVAITTLALVTTILSSCSSHNFSLREPNARVEFNKADFVISEQFTAEAQSTRILTIDWERLFQTNTGTIEGAGAASIPIIGSFISDNTANLALYEIMKNNPGYDVAFYPSYETKISKPALGIGILMEIKTVKVTTRLGKLKP